MVRNYVQDILTSMSDVGILIAVAALSTAVRTEDSQISVPTWAWWWSMSVGILMSHDAL
jgi:hypothetical protein